ncbi:hypothetical protein A176_005183 [Myxococcus hansupus]|uniref:Uncharacterized protein n=1 Tax=Pseudomyxococcus hansupus TaxID=1297742 RepID=A0A0H4WXY6_9BACT|nr:RHS repeat-associated core domain-containing protein [Myxococcus hansupus]AKQ68271.1 hypothetical protein A176_005183 [Myxococcus hansupus]
MKPMSSSPWLGLAMGLVLGLWSSPGVAQLAPTGGHYGGRASDTGTSPGAVNASGGYSASIPLELPTSRGGLPVPISINSGTRGVGAVGLGWDIPLSYIRRDMTFAHRKPQVGSSTNIAPAGREQVTLFLQGQVMDLVPRQVSAGSPQAVHWVPRYNAPDLLLQEQGGTWVMHDGDGRTWTFTAMSGLEGTNLWLLTSITGPDNTAVNLTYDISHTPVPGGSLGLTIDLRQLLYNKHPSAPCFKNEVTLHYGPLGPPLSLSLLGDHVLTRARTLNTLDVSSRATCASATETLRTYAFTYGIDADTQQPRLSSVTMRGRQGTPEQAIPLPIASYTYGSATTGGRLTYAKTASIPMPTSADATRLSSTGRDDTFSPPGSEIGATTRQSLTDVTGDGLPDLVNTQGGKLWVSLNRPNATGATTLGTLNAQLQDSTFTSGPFESRAATAVRFPNDIGTTSKDRVWRQAMDVNGDGRIDLVDAAETPGRWVIYLNTPGTGPSGVKWVRRSYSTAAVSTLLTHLGHTLPGGRLPLSSRFSGRDRTVRQCWRWNDQTLQWSPHTGSSCGPVPLGTVMSADPEKTFTEWEVTDINGDGFPDLVLNSSPVETVVPVPEYAGSFGGQVVYGDVAFRVRPRDDSGNEVLAVYNLRGLFIDEGTDPFSSPVTLKKSACGVALWATNNDSQRVLCDLKDVNGDGLLDRVEGATVTLGTGSGFSSATLTLPAPGYLSVQENAQARTCREPNPAPPSTTPYASRMSTGLRDLTGDGIPDYVSNATAPWTVAVGTGVGFAPPVSIEVAGSSFTLSSQTERCDGLTSLTVGGLYDLNGDGKPEVVRLNGAQLDVYELSGGTRPGKPEAGRIIQVDNGYGALTTVGYRSAKEDGTTKHQVPFPEIVVASVMTVGSQGLGGTLAETRYAYGGAELVYDSSLHAFTLPGYQRSVAMSTVTVHGKSEGHATITDTYPLPAFDNTSKPVRFARYLQSGRVRDVTTVTSPGVDPWALLATDLTTYARRLKATRTEWGTKLFEELAPTGTTNTTLDCVEMAFPHDFAASFLQSAGSNSAYDTCRARGFQYTRRIDAWRGTPPPSTAHVATRSEVTSVDDLGRVLNVKHANDIHRADDDLCEETLYATPTGTGMVARVLLAPMSRRVWTCDKAPFVTYASESWTYDGLAAGSVSVGRATTHRRDRRDASGTVLGTVLEFTAGYDSAGNLASVHRVRQDGAARTVKLFYDDFGMGLTELRVESPGLPTLSTTYERDPLTSETMAVTDPNQTRHDVEVDGYGRPVRDLMTIPGEPQGVLSTRAYLGFTGEDPLGRRVVEKHLSDPVKPGLEVEVAGSVQTTFLDELARPRRTESPLGSDYGTEVMISGARTYDGLGRVVFEADPYPASQNASTAYGTSYFFNQDGTPSCSIRGNGPQAYTTVPDAATERLPHCYSRTFANHQEQVSFRDADSYSTTSPHLNVVRTATMTGAGRLLSRTTTQSGTPLEHATFTFDKLGHMTGMTRFQDPVNLTGPVTWSWTYDSFGQQLTWQEPDTSVRTLNYSTWGELTEVAWTESVVSPSGPRSRVTRYDALGRVTHTEDRILGVAVPDTVYDYFHDVGTSPTPLVTPTNVLGRLARTQSSLGQVFYSYDALGRPNAYVYTDAAGTPYVERTTLRADGALDTLTRYLPDTDYAEEKVWYAYDTAQRLTYVKYEDAKNSKELYLATSINAFGQVLGAIHGGVAEFVGDYANKGRRLSRGTTVATSLGSRAHHITQRDLTGREQGRTEVINGTPNEVRTTLTYDALGRLATSKARLPNTTPLTDWSYTYDALGNLLTQTDALGTADAAMSYATGDRDRLCRVGYGNGGLGGTACNVTHDSLGNIHRQPTRTGIRRLDYFPSGNVRTVTDTNVSAHFRYGALNVLRELDLRTPDKDARRTWGFGDLLELKEQAVNGTPTQVLTRHIPGPGGVIATRRGPKEDWVFPFGELRGARYTVDAKGRFLQDVEYAPFGEAKSSGSQGYPGTRNYSSDQWNSGESLEGLGLVHLGARLYDPAIGRFLSRDPLVIPRTAATTNPYGFAMNDPVNRSDPSGLDSGCLGGECQGPGGGFPGQPGGGGGPSAINDPSLYFPNTGASGGSATPAASIRAVSSVASFTQAPTGPQTQAGGFLKVSTQLVTGIWMGSSFDFDSLAARGFTVAQVADQLSNSTEGAVQVSAMENANYDRWSSFWQGFGDSIIFWCPGCTQQMRKSWNITSGGDSYYYAVGSLTGIVGMIVAPQPTSIVGPPKADIVADFNQYMRIKGADKVNPLNCPSNCRQTAAAVDHTVAGNPTIAGWSKSGSLTVLEAEFGSAFESIAGRKAIQQQLESWGRGSRGIVVGRFKGTEGEGHAFNVINFQGRAFFFDGRTPFRMDMGWKRFDYFFLMRTN